MIKITYIPQVGMPGKNLAYTWARRTLKARLEPDGLEENYDFSALQPGDEVAEVEPEVFPFSPLVYARCQDDGTLEVTLLRWYEGSEEPKLAEVLDG
jgi:hypothetical protein